MKELFALSVLCACATQSIDRLDLPANVKAALPESYDKIVIVQGCYVAVISDHLWSIKDKNGVQFCLPEGEFT